MGKILVIAEKPSVAKDIARVLGCKQKGEGFLAGERYIVSWAIGHLITLAEPENYDIKYKQWKRETLPILPEQMKLKVISKTRSQFKILKSLMNHKEVESLICATDSGREGELIFRYIYEMAKCKKKVQRLWISSMTDIAIQEGFSKLKDSKEYDNLYLSAKCRSEADWLVGMNATRAYTLQYNALLSIGRVQTPTLAIIVQRQKEINNFIPEDYYEVETNYGTFKSLWFDKKESETKIKKLEQAEAIVKKVNHKKGIVAEIIKEQKKMLPPLLYDLTELQRDCNKKFGFSAQKTLSIAQDLYEKRKMITYPRTDSRYLSDDMKQKVKKTLEKLETVPQYHRYVQQILSLEALPFGKRIMDNCKVTDHHAIIPTDGKIKDNLTEDEKKVYHTIVLRFLAVFFPQYLYEVTKVITVVAQEHFIARGILVLQEGWTAIYKDLDMRKKENKEEEKLPELKKGQEVTVIQALCYKKKTKPPALYTESSLLSAMENAGRFVEEEALKEQLKENGLGTPATRAAIIERLLTVGYLVRKGKTLIPTEKGMNLIEVVPEELKSPQTTGKWEKGLSSIAKGKMTDKKFMASIRRYVCFLVETSAQEKQEVVFEKETKKGKRKKSVSLGTCPLCQKGSILENTKAYYCSEWKNGCAFTIWKNSVESYGISLKSAMVKKLLLQRKINAVAVTLPQTGEKGKASLILSSDNSGKLEIMDFIIE